MMNPVTWLSTLDATLGSPEARAVMAQALRAVADVLEKPRARLQDQERDSDKDQGVVSAAGSLGAEIVSAPLEVAAAALGAAGEIVTSALGGVPSGGSRGGDNP